MSDPTLPTEGSLASDATVADSEAAPSKPSGGSIIRPGVLPKHLGRYQIRGVLGRGGMGAVYTADDPELGRQVAIKVLREDLAVADRDALRREAQALARLVHPNVVAVYDVGDTGERVFLVMQLVDGASIDQWAKDTHASRAAIVAAFRQAGRGIAAAHAAGLVHCDIKPGNILVDRAGVARVGDFGIAKIEAEHDEGTSSRIAGTPAYMAPEQAKGHATAASDQFSFCVALWEVLAGGRPFESTPSDAFKPSDKPRTRRPLKAAAHVQRALTRGFSPDPAARFPSMTALIAALGPPRWRQIAAISAIAAIVIAGTAIVAARASHDAPPPPPHEVAKPGRADISAIRHLTNYGTTACAYTPTVTSDNTVVFDRTKGDAVDLYAVPLAGGEPRQLTSAPTWEWRSHASNTPGEVIHLITDTSKPEVSVIAVLDLATKTETTLAKIAVNDAIRIGDTIYYTVIRTYAVQRISAGHNEELVTAPAGLQPAELAASPSGERIALSAVTDLHSGRLCWIQVAAAHLECFPFTTGGGGRPTFASNDHEIYYDGVDGLRRHDVTSGTDELVLANLHGYGGLAAASDGRAIVVSTCTARADIEDASTSPPRVLIDDGHVLNPAVASSGVLFYLRVENQHRIAVARFPDGHTTQITSPDLPKVRDLAASPDGDTIAFVEGAPHAGIQIHKTQPGGYPQPLTDDPRDTGPRWIDDDTIAFTRSDEHNVPSIYIVTRDGGPATRLVAGKRLVATGGGKTVTQSNDGVFWLDMTTHRERRITGLPSVELASLSPSGHWLAVSSPGQGIWREELDTPGAKLEHVMDLAKGQTNESLAITDEGHAIIAPSTWSGNLVVVPAVAGTRF